MSGSWSAEVPIEKLADLVAARVLEGLRAAARQAHTEDQPDRGGWPLGRPAGPGDAFTERDPS